MEAGPGCCLPTHHRSGRFITARSPFGLRSRISCLTFRGPELGGKLGRLLLCILQFPSVILPRNNHRPTVTGNGRNGSAHNHKRCRANWRNLQTGSEGVMGSERGRAGEGREGGRDGRGERGQRRVCRQKVAEQIDKLQAVMRGFVMRSSV